MTIHTEQLITNAVNLIKNCKQNTAGFSRISKTPSHLTYDVRRIEKQWELRGFITETDIKYLEHIYASSNDYLQTHVYLLGGWHKYKSYRHASHNMHTQKRLKRLEASKALQRV
tara:strand:+ start:1574 stop:1915 length:342 start_codon:yes stop_codon:yes gene_type:complete